MSSTPTVAPYGTWSSPISTEQISGSNNKFNEVHVDVSRLLTCQIFPYLYLIQLNWAVLLIFTSLLLNPFISLRGVHQGAADVQLSSSKAELAGA